MSEIKTFKEGNAWGAKFKFLLDIAGCPVGYGKSPEEAIESLLKTSLQVANSILQDIKPEKEYAESLIENVKNQLVESESDLECDVAKVTYKKPYSRFGYDTKALDVYSKLNPDVLKFKKETVYKASTQLKWKE